MRIFKSTVGVFLLLLAAATIATALPKELSLDELKARVQNAKPDERANLCVQIAERQVESADKLYTGGKADEAEIALRDVASYSQQASNAAGQTGHRLKHTEIAMRKMAHRLSDIKRGLPFEDQAKVQTVVDTLDKIRTDLLSRMFGKNSK